MEHQRDPYKEMYIHLYRRLEILQHICNFVRNKIDDTLSQSSSLYLEHLDQLAYPEGRRQFMEKLDALFETL